MTSIAKAKRIYQETGSFSVSSAKTGINRNTLKTWARRYGWRQQSRNKPKPELKPKGQWMQSLHHGQAHLIINSQSACSANANGAVVTAGDRWFPWNQCLPQCKRCMPHAT